MNGIVFDISNNTTSNLNLEKFLKVLGEDRFDSGPGVNPLLNEISAETEGIQTGGNIEQNYFDSVSRLQQFGFAAAGKGLDVYNPDPKNKESIRVAQAFRMLANQSEMRLAELKTGREVEKQYYELLKDPDIQDFTGGLPTDRPATMADLKGIMNTSSLKKISQSVSDVNDTYARSDFQTSSDVSEANKKLQEFKTQLMEYKPILRAQGMSEEAISTFIRTEMNKVGRATFDNVAAEMINTQKAETGRVNESARSAGALADLRDRTNPNIRSGGKGGSGVSNSLYNRAVSLTKILNGRLAPLQGHPEVSDVRMEDKGRGPELTVEFKNKNKASKVIPIDGRDQTSNAWVAVNNLLDELSVTSASKKIGESINEFSGFSADEIPNIIGETPDQTVVSPPYLEADFNIHVKNIDSKSENSKKRADRFFKEQNPNIEEIKFVKGNTLIASVLREGRPKNKSIDVKFKDGTVQRVDLIDGKSALDEMLKTQQSTAINPDSPI